MPILLWVLRIRIGTELTLYCQYLYIQSCGLPDTRYVASPHAELAHKRCHQYYKSSFLLNMGETSTEERQAMLWARLRSRETVLCAET